MLALGAGTVATEQFKSIARINQTIDSNMLSCSDMTFIILPWRIDFSRLGFIITEAAWVASTVSISSGKK